MERQDQFRDQIVEIGPIQETQVELNDDENEYWRDIGHNFTIITKLNVVMMTIND